MAEILLNENKNQTISINKHQLPIRVLHCVAGLDRGGYETFIMNIYRKIDKTKVQFDFLYSFDGVFNDEILSMGGKLYKIPFITEKGPFVYKKAVDHFLNKHTEYKIVHSHMDKFSGLIMKCAKNAKIPVRISHSHSTKNEGGLAFQIVKNYYGKMIDKNCTHRFACSKAAYDFLFNKNDNAKIINNGIDLGKFQKPDNRDIQTFTIVNVARFTKAKNHEFLIGIFNQVKELEPTSRLILAGTGPLQSIIKEKVANLNLTENIEFLNDCEDIPQLLSIADVFCMPSLFEGLPVSLVEAQGAGLPCVISENVPEDVNISGNVEFLSLEKDSATWAKELLKFKGRNRFDNAEKIIEKGFDALTTAKELEEFYINKYEEELY